MAGDDDSPYRAHLSKIPMFGSCTSEQLDRLAELGDTRTASDSDAVVREGDKGGTFFLITSGQRSCHARVAARSTRSDPATISVSSRCSTQHRVTQRSRPSVPFRWSRCRVLAFMQALDEIPTFRDSLLHGMARRLHELDQRS